MRNSQLLEVRRGDPWEAVTGDLGSTDVVSSFGCWSHGEKALGLYLDPQILSVCFVRKALVPPVGA